MQINKKGSWKCLKFYCISECLLLSHIFINVIAKCRNTLRHVSFRSKANLLAQGMKFSFLLDKRTGAGLCREQFEIDTKTFETQMNRRADVEITARCAKTRDWVLTKSALLQSKTVQWSATKINLNVLSLRDTGATDEAENTVTSVKLFGKNHWFLRLQGDGNITGTREQGNVEGKAKWINISFYFVVDVWNVCMVNYDLIWILGRSLLQ